MRRQIKFHNSPGFAMVVTLLTMIFIGCSSHVGNSGSNFARQTPRSENNQEKKGGGAATTTSDNYYVGNWKVAQANNPMPEYKPLIIEGEDNSYSWEEPVTGKTYTGSWHMEDGALIMEKAREGADWRVRVFKPGNEDGANDQIWIEGIGDGMGFYNYKGFRVR